MSEIEVLQTPREKKLQDMLQNAKSEKQDEQEKLEDSGERETEKVVFDESDPANEKEQEKLFGE